MGSLWLIRREEMAGVGNHHQLRAGDALRDDLAVARRDQPVRLPMNHKRGYADRRNPAVTLPGENSLQLCSVSFGTGKPSAANCNILIDPFPRRCPIVDKWHWRFQSFLGRHVS